MNKIKNIIRILKIFESDEQILKYNLFGALRQTQNTGNIVDWADIYQYSLKLDLISEDDDYTMITKKGSQIIDRINGNENEEEIKNYIFLNCIYNNEKFSNTVEFLKKFYLSNEKFLIYREEIDAKKFVDEIEILRDELDVISFEDDYWYVNTEFQDVIQLNQNMKKKRIRTQEELNDILKEQERIGNLAEILSLKYERNELKKKNWDDSKVERISIKNVSAGYDINSIRNKKSRNHDKFIEVKGRKYNENSFIISHNELEKAKTEGIHYVIYFWNNLKAKKEPENPTKIFIDPINKLKIKECENCLQYLVEFD